MLTNGGCLYVYLLQCSSSRTPCTQTHLCLTCPPPTCPPTCTACTACPTIRPSVRLSPCPPALLPSHCPHAAPTCLLTGCTGAHSPLTVHSACMCACVCISARGGEGGREGGGGGGGGIVQHHIPGGPACHLHPPSLGAIYVLAVTWQHEQRNTPTHKDLCSRTDP